MRTSNWQEQAIKALEDSLHPVPQELNGIDWKCALSDKSDRLAQHICAFSNTANGGFLVFGVNDDTTFTTLSKNEIEEITNKLGNIAKNNLAWSVQLEHTVVDYQGHVLLFIRIPEQTNKPIYLRGKDIYEAYIRSAGHTVKMSKEQVHELLKWFLKTYKREPRSQSESSLEKSLYGWLNRQRQEYKEGILEDNKINFFTDLDISLETSEMGLQLIDRFESFYKKLEEFVNFHHQPIVMLTTMAHYQTIYIK